MTHMAASQDSLLDRLQAEFAAVADQLPNTTVRDSRSAAVERLAAAGLPTNRDENWRYANLRALSRSRFAPIATHQPIAAPDLPAALDGFERYVFVDGQFAAGLSATPSGNVGPGIAANSPTDMDTPAAREARFALISDAFAVDGLCVHITAADSAATGASIRRIEVLFVATADATIGSSYPRLSVRLEANTRVHLIERHVSVGAAASMVNSVIDVSLDRDARLDHVRLQQLGARTTLVDTLDARLASNTHYQLHCIAYGAAAARSTLRVALQGDRSRVELTSGCLASGTQTLDTYAVVDHAAPGATTRELFRGIASGRSRIAFNGKMVVRQNARDADSVQMLKGLLAGSEAEIDIRPQLEIYTDAVKAAHGATTGKLDDAMLFYLLSRGIERDIAQSLLKWAFIEDALLGIRPEALRRQLERELSRQFQDIAALDGLLGDVK